MITINEVKTYSIKRRASKVNAADFAKSPRPGKSFKEFYRSLPGILKAKDLCEVADATVLARRARKSAIL